MYGFFLENLIMAHSSLTIAFSNVSVTWNLMECNIPLIVSLLYHNRKVWNMIAEFDNDTPPTLPTNHDD